MIFFTVMCFVIVRAQYSESPNELSPNPTTSSQMYFGAAVAASHEYVAVVSPCDSSIYVYKYNYSQSDWKQSQTVSINSNNTVCDKKEWSVSIFEDEFVVGGQNLGKVFVFKLNATNDKWHESQILPCPFFDNTNTDTDNTTQAQNENINDYCSKFGTSVDITENYIIVGHYNKNKSYIFSKNRGSDSSSNENINDYSWIKIKTLEAINGDSFGYSVSISYQYAVVGAPYLNKDVLACWDGDPDVDVNYFSDGQTSTSMVYIFEKSDTTQDWSLTQQLTQNKGDCGWFGYDVSIDGFGVSVNDDYLPHLVVSDVGYPGSITIYQRIESSDAEAEAEDEQWQKITQLKPKSNSISSFGKSVSIYNDTCIVGAANSGNAFVYKYDMSENSWYQNQVLEINSTRNSSHEEMYTKKNKFGFSVSAGDGEFLLVGAPGWDKCYSFARNQMVIPKYRYVISSDAKLITTLCDYYELAADVHGWSLSAIVMTLLVIVLPLGLIDTFYSELRYTANINSDSNENKNHEIKLTGFFGFVICLAQFMVNSFSILGNCFATVNAYFCDYPTCYSTVIWFLIAILFVVSCIVNVILITRKINRWKWNIDNNNIMYTHDKINISKKTRKWLSKYSRILQIIAVFGGVNRSFGIVNSNLFGWDIVNMGLPEYEQHIMEKDFLLTMFGLVYMPNMFMSIQMLSVTNAWCVSKIDTIFEIWSFIAVVYTIAYLLARFPAHFLIYKVNIKFDSTENPKLKYILFQTREVENAVRVVMQENFGFAVENAYFNGNDSICFNLVTRAPIRGNGENDFYNYKLSETRRQKIMDLLYHNKEWQIKCKEITASFVTHKHVTILDILQKDKNNSDKQLLSACKRNDFSAAEKMIERSDCDLNVIDRLGNTTLMIACQMHNFGIANALVNQERFLACSLNWRNNEGKSGLLIACELGDRDIMESIVKRKDCNINIQDSEGNTGLIIACINKNYQIAKVLAQDKRCNLNTTNILNRTALYYTVWQSDIDIDIFNVLTSRNSAKYDIIEDENHETILHPLCMYNDWKYLAVICQKAWKCDFNRLDRFGYSPLMVAVYYNSVKCVEILCKQASRISTKQLILSVKLAIYLCLSFDIIRELLVSIFNKLSIVTWQSLERGPEMQFLLHLSSSRKNKSESANLGLYKDVSGLIKSRESQLLQQRRMYSLPSTDVECLESLQSLLVHCKRCNFGGICSLLEEDDEHVLLDSMPSISREEAIAMKITSPDMYIGSLANDQFQYMADEKIADEFKIDDEIDKAPTILNKWILDKKLGKGGFAWVHRAVPTTVVKHSNFTNYVALKFIPNGSAHKKNSELLRKQVLNEIKVYKSIGNHENIVKLYSYEMEAKYPKEQDNETKEHKQSAKYIDCMVLELEYCQFGSIVDSKLIDIIHNSNKIQSSTKSVIFRTYFRQLISALKTCHSKGIIHRDLKLGNLLIDSNYQLKVSDFGICKLLDIIDESNTGAVNDKIRRVGTRGFMAPEIILGRQYDKSCDIFSAGVVLFYLLFGKKPFSNASIDDKNYTLVVQQQFDSFWNLHKIVLSKYNKENSKSIKDLLWQMFEFIALTRIKIFHIVRHDWYNGEYLDSTQLYDTMKMLLIASIANKTQASTQKIHNDQVQSDHVDDDIYDNLDITLYPSEWHEQQIKYISDPLVIMIGCGNYDNDVMPSLIGVTTDYKRVINAFHNTFGYSVLYKTENDETKESDTLYLTKTNENNNNTLKSPRNCSYKLYWTYDDVQDFIEESRDEYFAKNKHDSLILIISSHGEEELMLTSDGDEYSHVAFLKAFGDKIHDGIFTNVPKICIFDMCRGGVKPIIPKTPHGKKSLSVKLKGIFFKGDDKNGGNKENHKNSSKTNNNEKDTKMIPLLALESNQSNKSNKSDRSDNFRGRSIITGDFHLWRRIYANPDGYAAIDGGAKGGYLIRGLCNTLLDTNNVITRDLDEVINQVRMKTKSLTGNLLTEIVEDVNDIHYKIFLKIKNSN